MSKVPSWRPPDGPLPDELATLGARLEAAADRTLRRRRALRRSLVNGLLAVVVGAPLALGAAAVDLAPSDGPVARQAAANALPEPSYAYVIQHVPDLSFAASAGRACVADQDCRAPDAPSPVPVRLRTLY